MQWFVGSALKSKEPQRRLEALRRLADLRDRQSISAVVPLLADPAFEVRLEVVRIVARWKDENSLRLLTHALRDPQAEVRERAVTELGALGARESIPDILPFLCDVAMPVRTAAVQTLHILSWMPVTPGERALEAVGRSEFGRAAGLGREALELLLPFTAHASSDTRRNIAEALGLITDPQAAAALHQLMADADPGVRIAALTAIAKVEPTVSLIARALNDPDKHVRMAAVETLGELRKTEAVPFLSTSLQDSHWQVRCAAATALAMLGERSTMPLLVQGLSDVDADMRIASAEALGLVGDAEAIEALILAQLDPETAVRQAALKALVRIDYRWHRNACAYQTLPALKRALRSKEFAVRNAAMELMERIFGIRRPSLRAKMSDPAADRRTHAIDLLITCLWDDNAFLRGAAAETLGSLRSSRARDALRVKTEDANHWVRQQAAQALSIIEETKSSSAGGWKPALTK